MKKPVKKTKTKKPKKKVEKLLWMQKPTKLRAVLKERRQAKKAAA